MVRAGLLLPGIEDNALLMAVVWPVLITAVFLPLAVRRYQNLGR